MAKTYSGHAISIQNCQSRLDKLAQAQSSQLLYHNYSETLLSAKVKRKLFLLREMARLFHGVGVST